MAVFVECDCSSCTMACNLCIRNLLTLFYVINSCLHMEMDQHFIAAISCIQIPRLLIVFDKLRCAGKRTTAVRVFVASLSRTLNTSLTMIIVLLTMFLFFEWAIRGFIFAMLVGNCVGTYSSLFITTQWWMILLLKRIKAKLKKTCCRNL
jgi:SecD/SecF fusion protein